MTKAVKLAWAAVASALVGWTLLTAGLAAILGRATWLVSVGVLGLLLGLAVIGWAPLRTILRDGAYTLLNIPTTPKQR